MPNETHCTRCLYTVQKLTVIPIDHSWAAQDSWRCHQMQNPMTFGIVASTETNRTRLNTRSYSHFGATYVSGNSPCKPHHALEHLRLSGSAYGYERKNTPQLFSRLLQMCRWKRPQAQPRRGRKERGCTKIALR